MPHPFRRRSRRLRIAVRREVRSLRRRTLQPTRTREARLLAELRALARRTEAEVMTDDARARAKRLRLGVVDEVRFLRQWAGNPLKTGAVAPSGQALSRLMARFVEPDRPGVIVELGPGTGAVTQALIERGVEPERLVLIEYSPEFCKLLRERFPGARVLEGNAYHLGETMARLGNPPIASVISGLPLFTRPLEERQRLLADAMDLMGPGAPFIQFSYALVPPVKRALGYTISSTRWVLSNLPPARVWLYRAVAADPGPAPALA